MISYIIDEMNSSHDFDEFPYLHVNSENLQNFRSLNLFFLGISYSHARLRSQSRFDYLSKENKRDTAWFVLFPWDR